MKTLYWVGIKESEIRSCRELFTGSVTYNGSGKFGNICYSNQENQIINYNEDSDLLDSFVKSTLLKLINEEPEVKFMFYTPSYAYHLGSKILEHTICINSSYVLNLLRDKLRTRLWLSNTIPVLKTVALAGNECSLTYFKQVFPGCESFVLQGCTGAGGNDTYVINKSSWKRIVHQLNSHEIYIVSPHLKNSYSVNIHALLGNNIILLPASVQIIENEEDRLVYHGADFIEYENVAKDIKTKITSLSRQIALQIKNLGYRGVIGIDYIIDESGVYFLEINPRFQSSTPLINLDLVSAQSPTVQEMVLNIFNTPNYFIPEINIAVKHSNYIIDAYNHYGHYSEYLKNALTSKEVDEILHDGFLPNIQYENRASLFSIVLNTNIVTINPNHTLNIHENIRAYSKSLPKINNSKSILALKTKLLIQGIRFSDEAQVYLQEKGMRRGTYSSVDIYLTSSFIINCPLNLKLCEMTPFMIDCKNDTLYLLYAGYKITKIKIDCGEAYRSLVTKNGFSYSDLSFLATDRLRIHHSLGCYLKEKGCGCLFCDVPGCSSLCPIEDIYEVIDWHLMNSDFRHILIGGGSGKRSHEADRIRMLIQYLRRKTNKDIYLMSLPPENKEILTEYYNSGLNEIAFNIEIFNRKLAEKIMPGKGKISIKIYQNALLEAVKLWGKSGNVKCLIIYGLEADEIFLEGIHWLASHGIQPVISVFRPLPDTEMAGKIPPESSSLQKIFYQVLNICQQYDLIPGPDCIYCQNNTLSLPTDMFFDFHN